MTAAFAQAAEDSGLQVLTETQLEVITAGSADGVLSETAGGTIVANGSSADVVREGTIDLSDNAGQDAKGLNLGNAADSAVANAVNVWDGRIVEQNIATGLEVEQSNYIQQDYARAANISGYDRDSGLTETSMSTSDSTSSGNSSLVSNTMVDTTQTVGGGGLKLGGSNGTGGADTGGGGSDGVGANELGVPEVTVQVGKGVALSGTVDFSVDSAGIDVGISAGASLTNNTRNLTTYQGPELAGPGDTKLTGSRFSNDFTNDFELAADVAVDFALTTPAIELNVAGSGCFVMVGKCSADGDQTDTWDNTASSTDSHMSQQRGALAVDTLEAEYVVVDESTLTLNSLYSVTLSGSAQQGAMGLNVVNASGSLVSNAVNIAKTPTVGPALNLTQRNVVGQRL